MIRDHDKKFGDNFVWCMTKKSFDVHMEIIKELTEKVKEDYVVEWEAAKAAAAAGGAGGEDGEEGEEGAEPVFKFVEDTSIIVEDLPLIPKPYESETRDETHTEVKKHSVVSERPLLRVQMSKQRRWFGGPAKFNNSENSYLLKPSKDPNFALQRREQECGVQAVPDLTDNDAQTTWFMPTNSIVQYDARDVLEDDGSSMPMDIEGGGAGGVAKSKKKTASTGVDAIPIDKIEGKKFTNVDLGFEQLDTLGDFLMSVVDKMEDSLQQNETVNLFKEEF